MRWSTTGSTFIDAHELIVQVGLVIKQKCALAHWAEGSKAPCKALGIPVQKTILKRYFEPALNCKYCLYNYCVGEWCSNFYSNLG
jgi:hypothetical protein